MVALGTTLSAFWIMANNTWIQVPVGYVTENGRFVPNDWFKINLSPVLWVRFPHVVLAAYLTGAFCAAATEAWYTLRGIFAVEARIMLRMGVYLAAVLLPVQLVFSDISTAITSVTISQSNSRRSKGVGTLSSRRAKCSSGSPMRPQRPITTPYRSLSWAA
jgi:cytochrome bd-type quinol oxidase subunit 1